MDESRVIRIVGEVLELPAGQREEAVRELCGSDAELLERTLHLVRGAPEVDGFLDAPMIRLTEASEPRRGLAPGTRVGIYGIKRWVASGGSADVYEARSADDGGRVAVKVMRPGVVTGRALRRFQGEVEHLRRMSHPNIAAMLDAGFFESEEGARPFFAMEFVDGSPITLSERVRALDVGGRVEIVLQVCGAIEHAHQRGVVHRDIKPSNVLVVRGGEERGGEERAPGGPGALVVKVLDFGIAKSTNGDSSFVHSVSMDPDSTTKGWIGTLPYMSPEQVRGDAALADTRSDVYSLGVLMYELLSGCQPYEPAHRTIPDLIQAIIQDDPPGLGTHGRVLRGDIDTIVAKAMAKDPDRRYQSVGELAGDLRCMREGMSIRAVPPSAGYRARLFVRRHPVSAAIAGVALVSVVVGVPLVSWQAVRATRAEARAVQRADDLRQLARALTDLNDSVARRSGLFAGRSALAERIGPLLDKLANEPGKSDELKADLAVGYLSIARMQGMPTNPNHGDLERSASTYERAIVLLEEIQRAPEPQRRNWFFLQKAHMDLAENCRALTQRDRAERHLRRASEVIEGEITREPANVEAWTCLARTQVRWSRQLAQWGAASERDALARAIVPIGQRLDALAMASPRPDYAVGEAMLMLGNALVFVGSGKAALARLDRAEPVLTGWLEANPSDIHARLTLGDVHRYRSSAVRLADGSAAAAIEAQANAVREYRIVHDADPALGDAADVLMQALLDLAELRAGDKRFAEATSDAGDATLLIDHLCAKDPSDARLQQRSVACHATAAEVFDAASRDPSSDDTTRSARRNAARTHAARVLELGAKLPGALLSQEQRRRLEEMVK